MVLMARIFSIAVGIMGIGFNGEILLLWVDFVVKNMILIFDESSYSTCFFLIRIQFFQTEAYS